MKKALFLLVIFLFLFSNIVTASVGLGISPSRMEYRIEGGKTLDATYTVYNTGTDNVIARFGADGDIKPYVTFLEDGIEVPKTADPDHATPSTGKQFSVRYAPPPTRKPYTLTGYVVATGGPAAGSTLGGNVAVAMRVSIHVGQTKHFWDYITQKQWIIGGSLLGLLVLVLLLLTLARKKGIHLKFEVNKPRK